MTFKYNKVYINGSSTVAGPYEKKGPLKKYFDMTYSDLYAKENSWEKAEIKYLHDSVNVLLTKIKKSKEEIDLFISGDLLNQVVASSTVAATYKIPFLGIYNACATSIEGVIIGASMIEAGQIKNAICSTSSHNLSAEKQFRYPTEYGGPKPRTATFTATGGASLYLSTEKSSIKVDSSTIGTVIDLNQTDAFHMGAAMAPAAADTIYKHLKNTKREVNYYDLILTGDLGLYGKDILIDYMEQVYGIDLSKNYNDCGIMLYDLKKQKQVNAGGSGPVCSALVNYSFVIEKMKNKELKKVLLIATGALFSPTTLFQKSTIPAIAHAISLEAIE
jgi:stage V sporulation protein AD